MNIASLKEVIKDLPDSMEVVVSDVSGEFNYIPASEIKVKKLLWSEDGKKEEPYAETKCLIIL